MYSLLSCRMKRAVFLRDARSRFLHFHDFEGYAKTHSQNIKTKGRQNGEIFNFALKFK